MGDVRETKNPGDVLPPLLMKLVEMIGFEPIHPKGTDLQSAAALQLYRISRAPEYLRVRRGPGSMRRYSVTTIRKFLDESGTEQMEREKGIEPSCDLRLPAWKAGALPMDHSRLDLSTPNVPSVQVILPTPVGSGNLVDIVVLAFFCSAHPLF